MSEYHEPYGELTEETRDQHRAMRSLIEEIEAVDWYNQRVAVCRDDSLRAVLAHNRDEEMEHACMALEWLRRSMPGWDEQIRSYLFSEGEITRTEEEMTSLDPRVSGPAPQSEAGGGGGHPGSLVRGDFHGGLRSGSTSRSGSGSGGASPLGLGDLKGGR